MSKKYFVFDREDATVQEFENKTEVEEYLNEIITQGSFDGDLSVDVVFGEPVDVALFAKVKDMRK